MLKMNYHHHSSVWLISATLLLILKNNYCLAFDFTDPFSMFEPDEAPPVGPDHEPFNLDHESPFHRSKNDVSRSHHPSGPSDHVPRSHHTSNHKSRSFHPFHPSDHVSPFHPSDPSDHVSLFDTSHGFSTASASDKSATFTAAVATWYGPPQGPGSGGGCGFENDVANAPYNGLISTGNQALYRHGDGCGSCYLVKCTQTPCSGKPIVVTITDECPGECNNDAVHFDLSGKAFGLLAHPDQDDALRKLGRIDVQYQRIDCHHRGDITIKIDSGSNPCYLAYAVEQLSGDGDIGSVEIMGSSGDWTPMEKSWGATFKAQLPSGSKGPYTVKITTLESKTKIMAYKDIPENWSPGQHYRTSVHYVG